MNPVVSIRLSLGARAPEYQSEGAAGADIFARIDGRIILCPGDRAAVPTGLFLAIPDGWEAQVRPRSGLALRHGITCLNSPGTIDSDYRGEIKVILANLGKEDFTVEDGDRIAQMVIAPVARAIFKEDELSRTDRAEGGFGSTGMK